jgi:glycosyltransferase involved in cell wall biosynthesis
VANYESNVGYAWWLMEHFWNRIATVASAGRVRCVLAYPVVRTIPGTVAKAPVEIIEFRFSAGSLSDSLAGFRFIRRNRVRSIYLTDWPYIHWCYPVWRLLGVRSIVIHDHSPGDRPPIGGWRGALKSALHGLRAFSASFYVAVSEYIGRRMRLNGRVPPARCAVVTNGIRLFDRASVSRQDVRRRIGVSDDAVVVVLVSRATEYKNIDFAVRCVAQLVATSDIGRRLVAIHCGDGPHKKELENLCRRLGLADRFRLLGERNDVREILCAADIAFHPSRGEAMSLAILEFMCAELAVLVSDLPSVSSAIEPGVTGLTYRAGDVDAAVHELRGLVLDPERRKALGMAAGHACRTQFSLESMDEAFDSYVIPAVLRHGVPMASATNCATDG